MNENILTEARARSMHGLVSSGKTLKEVGEIFGVTRQRVQQILIEYGYPSRRPRVTQTCQICFVEVTRETRKEHNRSPRHLALRMQPNSRTEAIPGRHEAVVQAYLRGDRVQDIADRFGFSFAYVYKILKCRGVSVNRGGSRYVRTAESVARASASQLARWEKRRNGISRETLLQEVAKALEQGMSISQISSAVGLPRATAQRYRAIVRERMIHPYDAHSEGSGLAAPDRAGVATAARSTPAA